MRVYLDGEELTGPFESLDQALEAGRARATALGRMVVEALGDGQPIPGSVLENPASDPGTWTRIDLASEDPSAMVASALREAAGLLAGAREAQTEVVASIDAGEVDSARRRLEHVLGVWGTCVATLRDGAGLLGVDLAQAADNGHSGEQAIVGLLGALGEVKRCLGAEDWATLSDVVGEDLEAQAQSWETLLHGLMARIGAAAP